MFSRVYYTPSHRCNGWIFFCIFLHSQAKFLWLGINRRAHSIFHSRAHTSPYVCVCTTNVEMRITGNKKEQRNFVCERSERSERCPIHYRSYACLGYWIHNTNTNENAHETARKFSVFAEIFTKTGSTIRHDL